jgi:hypothetical protein
MEPVLMMTSQSAATAAAFAIDDNASVQAVNYAKLSAELRADKQLLALPCASEYLTNNIILDQGNTCFVTPIGSWTPGANSGGWNGDYWHDGSTGKGAKAVYYTPIIPTNGTYDVYLWWVAASNRATNTPVDIVHANGTTRVLVNQVNNGSTWFKVLRTNFNAGASSSVIIRNDGTLSGTYCVADGVRWAPVGFTLPVPASATPTVEIVASDAVAGEFGTNIGRFTLVRNNDTALAPLTVRYTISGTASNGVDYALLTNSIIIPTNALATNIIVTPLGGNLAADQSTITLTLLTSSNFSLTTLSNATLTILDRPINSWRRANFSPSDLADPLVSGDLADPDQDGYANLTEYALGLPPKNAVSTNQPFARIENGYLTLTYTRLKSATDVSLVVEQSNDLLTWQSGPSYIQQLSVVDEVTIQRITVRLTSPTSASAGAYLRLKVTRL